MVLIYFDMQWKRKITSSGLFRSQSGQLSKLNSSSHLSFFSDLLHKDVVLFAWWLKDHSPCACKSRYINLLHCMPWQLEQNNDRWCIQYSICWQLEQNNDRWCIQYSIWSNSMYGRYRYNIHIIWHDNTTYNYIYRFVWKLGSSEIIQFTLW